LNNHVFKTLHCTAITLALIFTAGHIGTLFCHDAQADLSVDIANTVVSATEEGQMNPTVPELSSDPAARGRICTGATGEIQGLNCIPAEIARKARGACRGEGQDIDGKDIGTGGRCCPGLTAIPSSQPDDGGCTNSAPPSILVCTYCGDGICGQGENRCNCPTDCASQ